MKSHVLFTAVFILLSSVSPFVSAQNFAATEDEIDARLEKALTTHSSTLKRISEEKVPLSTEVNQLERKVIQLREEQERLLRQQDNRSIGIASLRREVDSLQDTTKFINDRLQEFLSTFSNRIDYSELSLYESIIADAQTAPSNVNLTEAEKFEQQLKIVEAGLDRLGQQLGGRSYTGTAVTPDGKPVEGTFVAFGPTVFFVSGDGQYQGLIEKRVNSDSTFIVPLPGSLTAGLPTLAQSGTGTAPMDATGGRALKIERASKALLDYVEDGGVIGYVIIGLGAVSILLALFKVYEIMAFTTVQPRDVELVVTDLHDGKEEDAQAKASKLGGMAGEMMSEGVRHWKEKRGMLEELLYEKVLKARPDLERFLPFLAIVAAAAPLLGLLGTVVGMIKTFNLITIFGTGDAKSLSDGISEALVTTALGLIVAIPVLLLHGSLARMAKRKLGLLEQGAVGFINSILLKRTDEA